MGAEACTTPCAPTYSPTPTHTGAVHAWQKALTVREEGVWGGVEAAESVAPASCVVHAFRLCCAAPLPLSLLSSSVMASPLSLHVGHDGAAARRRAH